MVSSMTRGDLDGGTNLRCLDFNLPPSLLLLPAGQGREGRSHGEARKTLATWA